MGSKTWNSLPVKPLPGRINVVLSSSLNVDNLENVLIYRDMQSLMNFIDSQNSEDIFIIGGSEILKLFIDKINTIHPDFN